MLNHARCWVYVSDESRPFVVLDGLLGLYGLKYDSVTAYGLPLYLCSYKLDGSLIASIRARFNFIAICVFKTKVFVLQKLVFGKLIAIYK